MKEITENRFSHVYKFISIKILSFLIKLLKKIKLRNIFY
jgi:hypothetical protein